MASLVADYGTSSESDSETDASISFPATSLQATDEIPATSEKSGNFFTCEKQADDKEDDDRDSSDEESVASNLIPDKLPNPLALPNPLSDQRAADPSAVRLGQAEAKPGSVFTNRYQKAEEAKFSILEQHVKMTSTEQKAQEAGKKNVCRNFNKGKCRFGHRCKFAHNSDVVGGFQADTPQQASQQQQQQGFHGDYSFHGDEAVDDDSYMAQMKKKKRAGMNDGLKPSKRAMTPLERQRQQERPWTVNH